MNRFACAFALTLLMANARAAEFSFGEQTLKAPEGFVVERVAGPPLVDRPIVADFDELGRLYVADSSGSNDPVKKQLEEKPHRIVRLEDTDGDGTFDKSTVFADRMMFPEGTMWLDGSLYVSAPPSIWKLTDTNDDGVADKREEWFDAKTLTGCANDLHGPYLGPDGWIYWCKGAFAEQTYERPSGKPFVTRAAHIFRRRPEGGLVEAVMTGGMDNPVDVAFTREGERIFTTTFFQHPGGGQRDGLIHAIYGGVYGKVHDVIDDHKKTGELLPVLVHLGPAAPSGLTRYESAVFGREYQDNFFACNFNLQKVTRHALTPKGATFEAANSDFLSSDHHDFHPTDVIEDADGSLLVVDTGGWYKICCPTSQLWKPDVLGAIYRVRKVAAPKIADPRGVRLDWSRDLAERLGDPRPAVARRALQSLRKQKAAGELRNVLTGSGSVAQKRNAVWALAGLEQGNGSAEPLQKALSDPDSSVRHAAVHALAVNPVAEAAPELERLLRDPNLAIRRAAAEALGRIGKPSSAPALLAAIGRLEPAPGSALPDRIQEHSLIYALIEINAPEETRKALASENSFVRRAGLIALDQMEDGGLEAGSVAELLSSPDPVLKQTANWIVAHRRAWAGELAAILGAELRERKLAANEVRDLEQQLANLTGSSAIQEMLAAVAIDDDVPLEHRKAALRAIQHGRPRDASPSLAEAAVKCMAEKDLSAQATETAISLNYKERPPALAAALRRSAENSSLPLELRLRALGAVSTAQPLSAGDFKLLLAAIAPGQPLSHTTAAANVFSKARVREEQLLELAEAARLAGPMELNALLGAFEHAPNEAVGTRLLASLRDARGIAGLQIDRARQVFGKFPESIQNEAAKLFNLLDEDASKQAARIEQLMPSLKDGDVRRGQAIFNSERAACSACHAIGYLGGNLGPDLTRIGQVRTERDLLESIVYPSASLVRSYESVIVQTKDGEEHSGILRRDAPDGLVLATGPNAEIQIARDDVAEVRPGMLSLMPQGLDEQLSRQELADLLAFLKATRW